MSIDELAHRFRVHYARLEDVDMADAFGDWCERVGVDYNLRTPVWDLLNPMDGSYEEEEWVG